MKWEIPLMFFCVLVFVLFLQSDTYNIMRRFRRLEKYLKKN